MPEAFERKLSVTGDHGEEIVEIVGDAAREAAEGLHLARLGELIFERLPFRDIDADTADETRLAVFDDGKFENQPV